MPTRYRSEPRNVLLKEVANTSWKYEDNSPFNYEVISESPVPGGNHCVHFKWGQSSGVYFTGNEYVGAYRAITGYPHYDSDVDGLFSAFDTVKFRTNELNWAKLPSSSDFSALQFLAEIDDTIASFSMSFLKQLIPFQKGGNSALAWEFGVKPLVADILALSETTAKLSAISNLELVPYEDEYEIPPRPEKAWGWVVDSPLKVRHTGFIDLSAYRFDMMLDSIGFRPSLAEAWAVTPLSFMVDYLLPIGDFLDSFHNGGWIRTVPFNGWQTFKFDGKAIYHPAVVGTPCLEPIYPFKYYFRRKTYDVLEIKTRPGAEFERPSIRQALTSLLVGKAILGK
jgi:hypothetical protein